MQRAHSENSLTTKLIVLLLPEVEYEFSLNLSFSMAVWHQILSSPVHLDPSNISLYKKLFCFSDTFVHTIKWTKLSPKTMQWNEGYLTLG